jgi:uncharacterized membrane protein YbhN (UPF0104 family)
VRRLDEHTYAATLLAFLLAAGAVAGIAAAYGFGAFAGVWSHTRPEWIALTAGAELLTVPAYVIAYRAVTCVQGGSCLRPWLAVRVVAAGFGPFAASGGFALDKRALSAIYENEEQATVRVLGLGALEWSVLAPVACVCAIVLLASGNHRVLSSVLWSWAIAVPLGFSLGLWLAAPARRQRIETGPGRWRKPAGTALRGVGMLLELARSPADTAGAWLGTALYWALDIAAFYGAVRFAGLHIGVAEAILAFATGYALTRRSSPFGGAGVTEALMTFSLHWVGQPVVSALVAVVIYRAFNFVLPTLPALLTRSHVEPLVDAAPAG